MQWNLLLYKCIEIGVTIVVCIHTGTCSLTPSLDSNLCLYLSMREEKSLYRLSTAVHHCLMLAAWRFPLATNPSASCKSKLTLSFVSWNHEKWYLVVHLLWDKHFLHFVLLFKYILWVIEIFYVIRVIFPSTSLQNKEYKYFNKHYATSYTTVEVDNMIVWKIEYLCPGSELVVLLQ